MIMMKSIYRIVCVIFLVIACPLASTESEANGYEGFRGSFFIGAGLNFGSELFLGQLQTGLGYSLFRKSRFELHLGPQADVAFGRAGILADISAFLKVDYDFEVSRTFSVNTYGKVHLGYSIAFAGGGGAGGFNHGINFGLLPGIEFFLSDGMGVFAEAGFLHRIFGISPGHKKRHFPSVSINVGAMFRF